MMAAMDASDKKRNKHRQKKTYPLSNLGRKRVFLFALRAAPRRLRLHVETCRRAFLLNTHNTGRTHCRRLPKSILQEESHWQRKAREIAEMCTCCGQQSRVVMSARYLMNTYISLAENCKWYFGWKPNM
jgi:hypothetical protein